MKANADTVRAFDTIARSSLFRTDGPDIDLCQALIDLADAVRGEDRNNDAWLYLGEGGECCASDLIVGAYWALTEWHAGQWSPEYAAMCALGGIYSPGMESAPSEDDPAHWPYKAVGNYFAAKAK
jgi:hypothetical protein